MWFLQVSSIVTKALSPHAMETVVSAAQEGPVTIMVDESNKRSDDKACAILVRMFDPNTLRVENRFLDMPICNVPNAANLFSVVESSLQ